MNLYRRRLLKNRSNLAMALATMAFGMVFLLWILGVLFYRGCELLGGDRTSLGRARSLLEISAEAYRQTDNRDVLPVALGYWAEAERRLGETEKAERIAKEAADLPRSVEPAEPGKTNRPRKSSEEKGSVSHPRNRWPGRDQGMQSPLGAESGQRRQIAAIHRAGERVGTGTVGDKDDDRHYAWNGGKG